ncbi:MAG: polysaccharide biosynthesis C-terminal domain-containing protein [Planctomycetes bacterium]|nr:polysaccharide biosynthesis C-terminal domain-containing protein [Planctomycetota bacterium]MCC7397115.1 polysaccharide biosynthesis protein [Planctomycetota bacterium]
MGALRIISRNIASNTIGYLVGVVVALLLTPFVLDRLGESGFGIWSLVVAMTGYYGILDLGIRSAVGQYATRYWETGDIAGVSRTISTAVALTLPITGVLVLASIGLAYWAPVLFHVAPEEAGATSVAMLVMGSSVALSFPIAVFGTATYARQRFDIANLLAIGERLANAGLSVWVLLADQGLAGVAWVTAGTQLAAGIVRVVSAFWLLPGLQVGRSMVCRASVRELCSFGFHNFLINVADRVVLYTDTLVIGVMIDSKAVSYYTVGGNFIGYYIMLINSVAWPLTPYATSRDAAGDHEALRRLYLFGSKNIFLFAAVIGGGLIFLGHDFLAVWLHEHPELLSGAVYTSAATVMAVLAAATLVRGLMTCGKQILFGMREVRFLSRLSMLEAIANLGLSITLAYPLGLLGVALGTLIPIVCTQLVLQPRFLAKRLSLSLGDFMVRATRGGLVVVAVMGLVAYLAQDWLVVDGWGSLCLKGVVLTLPAVIVGGILGTTREEKQLLLKKLNLHRGG